MQQRIAELATVRALERAVVRHREAYNEYRKAETAALAPRHRLSPDERRADRDAAFRRFEAAANIVKKLAARLEAAAAKKAKQP